MNKIIKLHAIAQNFEALGAPYLAEMVRKLITEQVKIESIADDEIGMCSRCKEYTPVNDPCCNAVVWRAGEPSIDNDDYVEAKPLKTTLG